MAGHVKQRCVTEWRLIDEGNYFKVSEFNSNWFCGYRCLLGISPYRREN